MSKIRSNWGPPNRYLEKRGYMNDNEQTALNNNPDWVPEKSNIQSNYNSLHTNNAFRVNRKEKTESLTNTDYQDDPYIGEKFIQSMKEKWNHMWSNDTTIAPIVSTTTTSKPTTTTTKTLPTTTASNTKSQFSWLDGDIEANLADDAALENETIQSNNYQTENVNHTNITNADIDYLRNLVNCSSSKHSIPTNLSNGTKKGVSYIYFKLFCNFVLPICISSRY